MKSVLVREKNDTALVLTDFNMISDSIFHQCFTQKGLQKSKSDCTLDLRTQNNRDIRVNKRFTKEKEKDKIRRHLPIGTGEYSVGCLDIMCEHCEKGSFFRLYYPIEKTDIYVSS